MTSPSRYLVVGAGATGLAFADALVDHSDAQVTLVDRRDGPGGHWRAAYPFVRLHQASSFYGVASTLLGAARLQASGPEAGLQERASGTEVLEYFEGPVLGRLLETGRVQVRTRTAYGPDRTLTALDTGVREEVDRDVRIVDARYLSPAVPRETPPPFVVEDDARVVPVGDLPEVAASRFAVVGSGKTATDAVVWLLTHGVEADAITWVRPRDPWMLDRAVIQPDASVYLTFAADVMECASAARSLDHLFLGLEEAGVMVRIDTGVTPAMAKTPTLGRWELDLLREVDHVVRLGHVRRVARARIELERGTVALGPDTAVVHCAADGLRRPPLLPIWGESITLQPIRAGFPCFGAALAGFVEASGRPDREKNALCPPSPYGDTLGDWAEMTVRGTWAAAAFGAASDIRAWAEGVALNPARITGASSVEAVERARERLRRHGEAGLVRLIALGHVDDAGRAPLPA